MKNPIHKTTVEVLMASLSTVDNSACHNLPFDPNELCDTAADYCEPVSEAVTLATLAIALPLITLAGEMLIEGIIDTALMLKDLGKWCCRRKEEYLPVDDGELPSIAVFEENDPQPPQTIVRERVTPIWKKVFGILKLETTAVALGAIAIVTYEFGTLFSKNNCQSIRNGCGDFSAVFVDGCNWFDGFLVNMINQVIEKYL